MKFKEIEGRIIPVLRKHDVVRAGLFGSFARGDVKKRSDVDILVEFDGRKSLLDLAGLEIELENKLERKVDVLTYNSIHPLLRKRIMKEEVRII